jgi:hypothetical protein
MSTKGQALARPWWLLPPGRMHPSWWIGIGTVVIWLHYAAGPAAQFPVLYVIPVIVAAWYSGRQTALALALAVPLAHVIFLITLWTPPESLPLAIARTLLRGGIIVLIAFWFARLSQHERDLERYVQRLEGLLAICAFCKGIRNSAGEWEPLEMYIETRSAAEFSHGLCPSCCRLHYPEFDLDNERSRVGQ